MTKFTLFPFSLQFQWIDVTISDTMIPADVTFQKSYYCTSSHNFLIVVPPFHCVIFQRRRNLHDYEKLPRSYKVGCKNGGNS